MPALTFWDFTPQLRYVYVCVRTFTPRSRLLDLTVYACCRFAILPIPSRLVISHDRSSRSCILATTLYGPYFGHTRCCSCTTSLGGVATSLFDSRTIPHTISGYVDHYRSLGDFLSWALILILPHSLHSLRWTFSRFRSSHIPRLVPSPSHRCRATWNHTLIHNHLCRPAATGSHVPWVSL